MVVSNTEWGGTGVDKTEKVSQWDLKKNLVKFCIKLQILINFCMMVPLFLFAGFDGQNYSV